MVSDCVELGDHVGIVGHVEATEVPAGGDAPLGFFRGGYARVSG